VPLWILRVEGKQHRRCIRKGGGKEGGGKERHLLRLLRQVRRGKGKRTPKIPIAHQRRFRKRKGEEGRQQLRLLYRKKTGNAYSYSSWERGRRGKKYNDNNDYSSIFQLFRIKGRKVRTAVGGGGGGGGTTSHTGWKRAFKWERGERKGKEERVTSAIV